MNSGSNVASDEFQFKPLDNRQVQETMKRLNPRKATGFDKIDPRLLKLDLAPSLTRIFKQTIRKGTCVTQWRHEEWVPVFKKDDRQEAKNCRPITVLPCVDKIYEKLLGKQISDFMDMRFIILMLSPPIALMTAVKPHI